MRFLFVDATVPYVLRDSENPAGGWAVQLRELLIGLRDAGHKSGVLTWSGANAYVGSQSICDLVETYDRTRGIPKLRFFTYFVPSMLSAARRYKPDVLFQSAGGVDTGAMAFIAQIMGVPFVHRLSSDIFVDDRVKAHLPWLDRLIFNYGLKRARLLLVQNDYQHGRLTAKYTQTLVRKIPSAVPLRPWTPSHADRAARGYIAWLASFRPEKNMPLLCRIAKALPSIEFHIAGGLPDEADPRTVAAVEDLKALPNVRFVGYLKRGEVPDFLSRAVALLCTSDFEGFSNTFLEAFASGTPVVTVRDVDPDSTVSRLGLGVVSADREGLAAAVDGLWAMDAEAYGQMSVRCRNYAETHHSRDHVIRELLSIVEAIRPRSGVPAEQER